MPRRTASAMRPATPDELADDQARDDAEGDRRGAASPRRVAESRDAGVGEREERHDQVARPGVEEVLEAFGDRDRLAEPERDRPDLGGGDVLVGRELIGDAVGVELGQERPGRGEQAERDAGDGGVDPGLEGGQPDAGAEDDVDREVADPRPARATATRPRPADSGGEPLPVDARRCRTRR